MQIFSWQMAEELAAAHMQAVGFRDARRTANGADGGIDVAAANAVAQVKHLAQPVGSPDIQRVRGAAHNIPYVLFYSSSGYTGAALEVADAAQVALFTFTPEGEVSAVNRWSSWLSAGNLRDEPQRSAAHLVDDWMKLFEETDQLLNECFAVASGAADASNGDMLLTAVLQRFVDRVTRLREMQHAEMTATRDLFERQGSREDVASAVDLITQLRDAAARYLELGRRDLDFARRGVEPPD
ncbi:restriction endonuclease [Curtobacterium sp. MCBD17_040]|uniref:restriction endonuclease n=1 Tax=Curtobacterium sp. MCBD17_040 TaxID=2175674 RepID=UPI0015E8D46B|nr:restriction endonuclease [Curtobacterium sp. MCBD17_040]WIB65297.1 restriction endonuclease [Curtobacterium sp. MCBD17_040]